MVPYWAETLGVGRSREGSGVAHTCGLSTWGQRQEDCYKFNTSLVYIMSSKHHKKKKGRKRLGCGEFEARPCFKNKIS